MIQTLRLGPHRIATSNFLNPLVLVSPVLLTLSLFLLPACQDGGPSVGASEADRDGALVGELQTFVVDNLDGSSTREHFLVLSDPARTRLKLVFEGLVPPSGTDSIRAWGVRQGEVLRVSAFERTDTAAASGVATAASALVSVTPKPRTAVFVIIDVGGGTKLTNATAASTVFSPGKNFADVYNQLSYGILGMSGDVVGPLSFPTTTCDYNGAARALRPMITGAYNHYMWYFATNPGCTWGGLGAEGNVSRPQSDSWYNASTSCTVLVQEVGHNMGWMHSSTLRCPAGASFADDPLTCTSSEYGNRYTPMGSGCGHFTAYDKWYGGLIAGCNGAKITTSGTFNLMPLENACNGLQAIQIPMLKTTRTADPQQGNPQPLKNYYLEYRGPWGLDTAGVKTPQVMVYAGDDIHAATKTSNWTWLLDMVPTSANTFEGLAVGQSFSDPVGGITIKVASADTTKAVVQIDITGGAGAAPVCIDGSTLEGPGPEDCGGAGGPAVPAGTAGTNGSAGSGGAGPMATGGARGTSIPGTGGRAVVVTGSGGATVVPGSGGATVVVGTGGGGEPAVGPAGAAGASVGTGGAAVGEAGGVGGGCACDVTTSSTTPVQTMGGLLGLAFLMRGRRRARRTPPV